MSDQALMRERCGRGHAIRGGLPSRGLGRGLGRDEGARTTISQSSTTTYNVGKRAVSATPTTSSISGMSGHHRTIPDLACGGRGRGRGRNNRQGEAGQTSNSISSTQGQRSPPTHCKLLICDLFFL